MNFNRNNLGEKTAIDPTATGGPTQRFWTGGPSPAGPPVAPGGYSLNFYTPLVDAGGPRPGRPGD